MRTIAAAIALILSLAACNNDATTPTPTPDPRDALPPPEFDAIEFVRLLAADDMAGRDNDTPQSARARQLLTDTLRPLANPPADGTPGNDAYLQPFEGGTNVIGLIPGTGPLADEYILLGAHYDHLAPGECDQLGTTDDICNGAADNAAGVAQVLAIATELRRAQIADPDLPRRSVLLTLWDREEDGLLGSRYYAANPLIPLDQTVTYVNFDIQGSSFSPDLATASFLVGAETGGPHLEAIVSGLAANSPLDYYLLSEALAQDRSDHTTFGDAGIPILLLTDAPNGCYHTVHDDIAHLDTPKLLDQIASSTRLVTTLTTEPDRPRFTPDAPPITYADAQQLLRLLTRARDVNLFGPDATTQIAAATTHLQSIVDAGPTTFDFEAAATILTIAATTTDQLTALDCP